MNREWKPGDVANVFCSDGQWRQAQFEFLLSGSRAWRFGDGLVRGAESVARPLVVIDPEDRTAVERLVSIQTAAEVGDGMSFADALQAALREFAEPTPAEPVDPKARVTDRRENIWRLLADGDWVCTSGPDIGEYLAWSGLIERGPLSIEVQP